MNRLLIFTACLLWATGLPASVAGASDQASVRMLTPEIAEFMKTSDAVLVFKVHTGWKWGDPVRVHDLILMDSAGRDALIPILAESTNYYQGLYCVGEMPPKWGFEFRKGEQRLDVITAGGLVEGISFVQGHRLTGLMTIESRKSLDDWFRIHGP